MTDQTPQKINSPEIKIDRGTLFAGGITLQIRNITSTGVYEINNIFSRILLSFGLLFASVPLTVLALIFAIHFMKMEISPGLFDFFVASSILNLTLMVVCGVFSPRKYALTMRTNSASAYSVNSTDNDFLYRVKAAIDEAMRAPEFTRYEINQITHKVENVSVKNTTITGDGTNYVDTNTGTVTQTSNVTKSQGLQDISALIDLIERSQLENTKQLKAHLEIVRSNLAGGSRSRAEAKSAWSSFVDHMGSLAKAGSDVMDMIARVGTLLA